MLAEVVLNPPLRTAEAGAVMSVEKRVKANANTGSFVDFKKGIKRLY
jgi:hypothetical protein